MTIKQIADYLGVSVSSVSRALNDHPDVSEEMQQQVRAVVEELGYEPHYMAQSLRRGATKSVGFNVRDISNPLFADIVRGAEMFLNAAGYSLLLVNSDQDPHLDVDHIKLFRKRRVDGLILSLQSERQVGLRDLVASLPFPVVLLDRELSGVETASVVCDNTGIARAVEHLIRLGHHRIALISGPDNILTTRRRLEGYHASFEAGGLAVDSDLIRLMSYDPDFGYEQTLDLLGATDRPTAIIAGSLGLFEGTLAACREAAVSIGTELSIVACDEVPLMAYLEPSMSVVRRNPREMGRLAAELLIDQLERDGSPRTVVVPTEYVPRASTAPVRK